MLTLLFPSFKKKDLRQEGIELENKLFSRIFKENSDATRKQFFGDPLVKHLWGKIFVIEFAEEYKSCLRKVRSLP